MNVRSVIRGVAALLVFWSSGARAQSEVNPDQFDSPNTEPFPQPKVKESAVVVTEQRFSGTFMLPYTLQCAGKRLLAGHYSLSLRSDGKTGRVTLNQKAQRIEIAGVVQKQARNPGPSALYVGLSGNARRLLAVHLAEWVWSLTWISRYARVRVGSRQGSRNWHSYWQAHKSDGWRSVARIRAGLVTALLFQ